LIRIRYQRTVVACIRDPIPVRILHKIFNFADIGASIAILGVPVVAFLVFIGIGQAIAAAWRTGAAVLWTTRAALARVAHAITAVLDQTERRAPVKVERVTIVALLTRIERTVPTKLLAVRICVVGEPVAVVV
jgi:hypothetical protein